MCRFALKPVAQVPAPSFAGAQQNAAYLNEAAFLNWMNELPGPVKQEQPENLFPSSPSAEMFSADTACSGLPMKNDELSDFGFNSYNSMDLGVIDELDLLELLKDREAPQQQQPVVNMPQMPNNTPVMTSSVSEPTGYPMFCNPTSESVMGLGNRQPQLCNTGFQQPLPEQTLVSANVAAGMLRPPMPETYTTLQVPEAAAHLFQSLTMPNWAGYNDDCNSKGSSDSEEAIERMKRKRRESAQRSRAKKNAYMKTLEIENKELKEEIVRLRKRLAKFEASKADAASHAVVMAAEHIAGS